MTKVESTPVSKGAPNRLKSSPLSAETPGNVGDSACLVYRELVSFAFCFAAGRVGVCGGVGKQNP